MPAGRRRRCPCQAFPRAGRRIRLVIDRQPRITTSRWYSAHSTHSPISTIRTIGNQSSSRAGGRDATAGSGAAEAPGAGAAWPSFSRTAADPGVIVDSPTSNRSTANRIGALGSTAPEPVAGLPDAPGDAAAVGDDGGEGLAGLRRRAAAGRPDRGGDVDAEQVGLGEGDARSARRARRELDDRAVRPLDAQAGRAGRYRQRDRDRRA